jgi:hypothetical protein
MRLTDARRRAIIEATIAPIQPFRRGFARSKAGPFIKPRTIEFLLRHGALKPLPKHGTALRRLTALDQSQGAIEHADA